MREVAAWAGSRRTSDGLSAPPRPKNSIIGTSRVIVGVGHPDLHDGAGQVAGEERLLEHLGAAHRLDGRRRPRSRR